MGKKSSLNESELRRLALQKLSEGTDSFNAWRKTIPQQWVKLMKHSFDGMVLDGADFHGVKLTGATFRDTSLKGSNFLSANLNKTKFTGADLQGAVFQGARLHEAILDGANLNGSNLSRTIRDGWSVKGVICNRCWIRLSPDEAPDGPDHFNPGEFETVFGGARVKVLFSDGFQPIDLAALPYYVSSFADKFPNMKLVFAGLNTLGTPSLEFRLEDSRVAKSTREAMQFHLDHEAKFLRREFANQLQQKDIQISTLMNIISNRLMNLEGSPMIIHNHNSGPTMIQDKGVQVGSMSGGEVKEINFDDPSQMAALAKDLDRLIDTLQKSGNATDLQIQVISEAATLAKENDEPGVFRALKRGGKWLLKFSNDIGVRVASSAIQQALGMK